MTYRDLVQMVENGRRPFVEFTSKIEEFDGYFDSGMRAKIVGASLDDNGVTVRINFDFEQFTVLNDSVEKHTYYDKNGNPVLSAKEAGCYPKDYKETFWFEVDDEVDEYFTFFKSYINVYDKYMTERKDGQSYTQWMEETIQSFYDKAERN